MNVLILALAAHTAVNGANAVDYRLKQNPPTRMFSDQRSDEGAAQSPWIPGVDGWTRGRSYCPALFERDLGNGSIFRLGSRCEDDALPYARPANQRLR